MSDRGFILEKCICCEVWFINYKGDYPFCEDCMVRAEKGLDTSTIPSPKITKVQELLEL